MSIVGLTAPARLTEAHVIEHFDCGTPLLNAWLIRQALKNEASGASRTYVVSIENRVVGYFCLSAGAIIRSEAPKSIQRNMPDPIPVMVLGRLAVDRSYQGQGIGKALLRDAVLRVLNAAEVVGVRAMLVHAISEAAQQFYLAHGFLASPVAPLTLCLPIETARRALAEG